MKRVRFRFSYVVTDAPVTLSVRIGNGQIGGSAAMLDGEPIGQPGEIVDLPLGRGRRLAGKDLVVKTIVADVNDSTNTTVVEYELRGGVSSEPMIASADVERDGDGVVYRTTFSFTAVSVA